MQLQLNQLPVCPNGDCHGKLLPFEDFHGDNISYLKAWACPICGFNMVMDLGKFYKNSMVVDLEGKTTPDVKANEMKVNNPNKWGG